MRYGQKTYSEKLCSSISSNATDQAQHKSQTKYTNAPCLCRHVKPLQLRIIQFGGYSERYAPFSCWLVVERTLLSCECMCVCRVLCTTDLTLSEVKIELKLNGKIRWHSRIAIHGHQPFRGKHGILSIAACGKFFEHFGMKTPSSSCKCLSVGTCDKRASYSIKKNNTLCCLSIAWRSARLKLECRMCWCSSSSRYMEYR